jgi:hypothetical protein
MFKGIVRGSLCLLAAASLILSPMAVYADSTSSSNYRADQTSFSSGSEMNACSSSYCSSQTAGDLGVGNTKGGAYQAYAGFNTTEDPFLEFVVTGANIDLGDLNVSAATTTTGTFYVRAWEASGYVVRSESDPPAISGGGHQMTTLPGPTASSPGTEQFGINLVRNINFCGTGCDLGANPQQLPDSTFSFGQAASGYNTSNLFKYVKGDVIAESLSSTSVTTYTVSYLYNISSTTPAGQYIFNHILVVTATY